MESHHYFPERPKLCRQEEKIQVGFVERCEPDTTAGAKETLPGSPILANGILEDANHISAGAMQTEWAEVDPLVQTQARQSSVVPDAEECREISKEEGLQDKLTQAEKESNKQKDREDRIARSRDRQLELEFRLREMTNIGEKSETKEQRCQEREAEQEQVIQKMNAAEENHQERPYQFTRRSRLIPTPLERRSIRLSKSVICIVGMPSGVSTWILKLHLEV